MNPVERQMSFLRRSLFSFISNHQLDRIRSFHFDNILRSDGIGFLPQVPLGPSTFLSFEYSICSSIIRFQHINWIRPWTNTSRCKSRHLICEKGRRRSDLERWIDLWIDRRESLGSSTRSSRLVIGNSLSKFSKTNPNLLDLFTE